MRGFQRPVGLHVLHRMDPTIEGRVYEGNLSFRLGFCHGVQHTQQRSQSNTSADQYHRGSGSGVPVQISRRCTELEEIPLLHFPVKVIGDQAPADRRYGRLPFLTVIRYSFFLGASDKL